MQAVLQPLARRMLLSRSGAHGGEQSARAATAPASQAGDTPVVKTTAISAMASRSSMTASESSSARTPRGSTEPASASTPSANAMSVATGIAQAPPFAAAPPETATATSAGTIIPPTAASNGSAAARRSASSPTTSSRLSSSPATKKKIASRASAAQSPSVRSRCSQAGPIAASNSQTRGRSPRRGWPTAARRWWRPEEACRPSSPDAETRRSPRRRRLRATGDDGAQGAAQRKASAAIPASARAAPISPAARIRPRPALEGIAGSSPSSTCR